MYQWFSHSCRLFHMQNLFIFFSCMEHWEGYVNQVRMNMLMNEEYPLLGYDAV
jgi:hypothetical protein